MPVNQSLHPREESYVNTRLTTVIANEWKNWISDGSAIGYNLLALNSSSFSKIGITITSGGYRVAQYDAGVLSALTAGTGVSLQVTSYLSELSDASQFLLKVKLLPYPVRRVPLLFPCGPLSNL
jgi:lysophospholipase